MSSSLLLRSAIAITRNKVKCTSLAAASVHSNSLSSLSLSSYYYHPTIGSKSGHIFGSSPSNGINCHSDALEPTNNIKFSMTNILANITGNGVFITTSHIQNNVEGGSAVTSLVDTAASKLQELSLWLISTLKRRKKMMNKHKLRKRRKKLRLKSKK